MPKTCNNDHIFILECKIHASFWVYEDFYMLETCNYDHTFYIAMQNSGKFLGT